MRGWALAVVLCTLVARAAAADPFQRHLEAAMRAYQGASYQAALDSFAAAYQERPLPRLLINLGKCQHRLGRPRAALDTFRKYLQADPQPDEETRRALDEAIAQARALLGQEARSPAAAPPTSTAKASAKARRQGWLAVEPLTREHLQGIGGAGPRDLWVAGAKGTLLHFDGTDWVHWSRRWGGSLHSIWGSRRDDVWAVGEKDSVLHWDGRRWSAAPTGSDSTFLGAWGAPGETRLLGGDGAVLRREAAGWSALPVELGEDLQLTRLFRDGKLLWAVGRRGTVLRFDGAVWGNVLTGTTTDLYAVWANGPRDVWLGGTDNGGHGVLIHFDGQAWRPAALPAEVNVYSLWGSSGSDVWAAGNRCPPDQLCHGTLLHFDGRGWSTAVERVPAYWIQALWGSGPADLWATGGGNIFHFDGVAWTTLPRGFHGAVFDLWGSGPADVWGVGAGGAIWHFDGAAWSNVAELGTQDLDAVWAGAAEDVWASGIKGALIRWNGALWSSADRDRSRLRSDDWRSALWGAARDDLWLLGSGNSTGSLQRWDGATWRVVEKELPHQLSGLAGAGPAQAWAVALDGTILQFDGTKWGAVPGAPQGKLRAAWAAPGDAWAVGSGGLVERWQKGKWTVVPSGTKADLYAISGTGPKDLWAVGGRGAAVHWNGRAWSAVDTGSTSQLNALWVGGGGEVWAAGEYGTLLHRPREERSSNRQQP